MCVIISTYSQRWIFDTVSNTAKRSGKIVGITYDDFVAPMTSIREAFVKVRGDAQAIGNLYQVYFRLDDDSKIKVAQRNSPESLIRILKEMVNYLPNVISPVLKNPSPLTSVEDGPT
jgi:hypothetical protein